MKRTRMFTISVIALGFYACGAPSRWSEHDKINSRQPDPHAPSAETPPNNKRPDLEIHPSSDSNTQTSADSVSKTQNPNLENYECEHTQAPVVPIELSLIRELIASINKVERNALRA